MSGGDSRTARPRRRTEPRESIFELLRPSRDGLPVLVSVPHAGLEVPPAVRESLLVDDSVLRADADLAVDELWREAPAAGAALLVARYSRYVVDLNRAAGDVDSLSVPEHPFPLADARRGVVWRLSTCGRPALARPLTLAELRERLARYHEPYHAALRDSLAELRARHGHAVLLDGHSMPGTARGENGGRRRADIVPGCDGGATCAGALLDATCRFFRDRGYSVKVDDPYRGGFITRQFGRPADGVHALQIEVNRELYLDPLTLEVKPRGLARLRADLGAFLHSLRELRLGRLG
jgi:N-formylglutamate amidohydrolase